ncbi:hypothetical protein F7725_006364 [Dissostichus mawsoni]|uniref:Uncharacterized protein n=1 Tax=Dissostichus mawsoni TaxID=36200 RepID=A0A7J5XTT2_DISMA|nr:hypothetical protein F7725_006364 [Dissostichus mawsoni]
MTAANMDIVYRDMEIALQQMFSHLDSIRKDMVILEKSDFANLRSENSKMKRELEQIQNRLKEESRKVRAETKLDINLESSRMADVFSDQEKKLLEASSDFHHKVASLKTLLESLKLETVRYLASTVFSCLAIALGVYRLWRTASFRPSLRTASFRPSLRTASFRPSLRTASFRPSLRTASFRPSSLGPSSLGHAAVKTSTSLLFTTGSEHAMGSATSCFTLANAQEVLPPCSSSSSVLMKAVSGCSVSSLLGDGVTSTYDEV